MIIQISKMVEILNRIQAEHGDLEVMMLGLDGSHSAVFNSPKYKFEDSFRVVDDNSEDKHLLVGPTSSMWYDG